MKKITLGIFVCMLLIAAAFFPATNANDSSTTDVEIKWEQPPDISEFGMDIRCDQNDMIPRNLSDDFPCDITGWITQVTFWGSWLFDEKGNVLMIHLSIHDDIPANQSSTGYSMPGDLLWEMDFSPDDFNESLFMPVPMGEWWYDPYTGELIPQADWTIWQYDIPIDKVDAFKQTGTPDEPVVYWLDVHVLTDFGWFGWKTSEVHWNDDAVFWLPDNPYWWELRYPQGHPFYPESVDMAFAITTTTCDCCVEIESITGGLLDPSRSLTVDAVLKNTGTDDCKDVEWEIAFNGGIILKGASSGTISSIPAGGTFTVSSDIVIGFAFPMFLPCTVTVTASCPDSPYPSVTESMDVRALLFLLNLMP